MMAFSRTLALMLAGAVLAPGAASAADPAACETVRLSDPGWTDITSTNALAAQVLEGLGYSAEISTLSVPIGYQAISNDEIDVFLGNWMPAQAAFREELDADKAVEVLTRNLQGAKFTLAVPSYVAEAGVTDFADLAANADKFGEEIYGIEAGAPANQNIQKLIESGNVGLENWSLVESSEQGMLSQVSRATGAEDWIVFLAWAPHPMNTSFDLTYLSGGDEYFGPDYGGAEVYTLARDGYSAQCPNAAKLFSQMTFTVDMENEMMDKILNADMEADAAAVEWLKANPDVLSGWLEGVQTLAGEPGLAAVEAHLAL